MTEEDYEGIFYDKLPRFPIMVRQYQQHAKLVLRLLMLGSPWRWRRRFKGSKLETIS